VPDAVRPLASPTARFRAARTSGDLAVAVIDHLVGSGGVSAAAVLLLDPQDGHLRGFARGPRQSLAGALDLDPLALGPAARALQPYGRTQPLAPGELPPPFDDATAWITAPIVRLPLLTDHAACPRVDCPERGRRLGVCGAAPHGREAWTRDRLTCGLVPYHGIVCAVPAHPGATRRSAETELDSLAQEVAPLFGQFRLQEALHDAEYFREDLFDAMTEALVATDARGDVLFINRAAEELTGIERPVAVGRPIEMVFGELESGLSPARKTLRDGVPIVGLERRLRRGNGEDLAVRMTTMPLTVRGWGVRGVLVTFVDLTPIKRMEGELRRLDRLASLGRFTSAVAHEVRNPLGGILAGVQYLRAHAGASPEWSEHLSFIESETHRLNRIVKDLAEASSTRPLQLTPVKLGELMARVVTTLSVDAQHRDVSIVWEDAAPPALADQDGIHQVLLNLCKNGLEACPPGGCVEQRAELSHAHGREVLLVSVTDSGPGLTDAAREHLFEPFFTTKEQGTGLGLYVCHSVVERHGSTLEVASRPGRTTFRFALPLASEEEIT